MEVTIEISNYPLNENYIGPILDFIERLNQIDGIKVIPNSTSTQLSGNYDLVMDVVQAEIRKSFEKYGQMVFVLKVLKGDLLEGAE